MADVQSHHLLVQSEAVRQEVLSSDDNRRRPWGDRSASANGDYQDHYGDEKGAPARTECEGPAWGGATACATRGSGQAVHVHCPLTEPDAFRRCISAMYSAIPMPANSFSPSHGVPENIPGSGFILSWPIQPTAAR